MIDEDDQAEEVLHADVELCDRLRAVDFAGPLWDQVAGELARYGWSVMSAWLSTRVIAGKCQQKGRRVDLPDDWSAEDREDLVTTAVAQGLANFRQALAGDRWKPDKGASLSTYFLGSCVLAFPNILRQWYTDRRRYQKASVAWAWETTTHRQIIEPTDFVDALHALGSLTHDESKLNQAIGYLFFHSYTPKEIAEILGISSGAVNQRLYRIRRRERGDMGGGEFGGSGCIH